MPELSPEQIEWMDTYALTLKYEGILENTAMIGVHDIGKNTWDDRMKNNWSVFKNAYGCYQKIPGEVRKCLDYDKTIERTYESFKKAIKRKEEQREAVESEGEQ